MAQCKQCGREMPSFTFGEQTDVCRECRERQKQAETIAERAGQPPGTPQKPRRVGTMEMIRMFPVTSAVVAINTLVFLACAAATFFIPDSGNLMDFKPMFLAKFGADFGPYTLIGEPWRVLTSMFLHGGFVHIALNMYCFWDFGRIAERVYGRWRYASIYLVTGIASSIASLAIHPARVSIGASGAIFGVAGALVYPFYRRRLQLPAPVMKSMMRSLGTFILINLLIGAAIPVIDNSAHVGGLVAGLILGMVWTLLSMRTENTPHLVLKVTAVSLLVCGAAFAGVQKMNRDGVLAIRSLLEQESGDKKLGMQLAQEAVARMPRDAASHEAMGEAWYQQKKYDDAVKEFLQATVLDPSDGFAQERLGESYVGLKQWTDAEAPLRNALKQDPTDPDVTLALGLSLAGQGRDDEALQFVQQSVGKNPNSARAQYTLAYLLSKKGEEAEARNALQRAVKLEPGNEEYRKALDESTKDDGRRTK